MTTELQNKAWACLPKEARNDIRSDYEYHLKRYEAVNANTAKGAIDTLEDLFGSHNLTSDTEPEEMLYQKRAFIMAHYSRAYQLKCDKDEKWAFAGQEIEEVLYNLFGDKCLPDKENTPKSGELKSNKDISKMETTEQPSVQVEPKFKVGDKVIVRNGTGLVHTITEITENGYKFDGLNVNYFESSLEPYTDPETKMTEERYQYLNSLSIEEYDKQTSSKEQDEFCAYQKKYHPDEVIYCQTHSNDEPETKDNMEEKELNLVELLKGCEGEKFFSISVGEIIFKAIYNNDDTFKIRTIRKDAVGNEYNVNFHSDGRRNKSGLPDLYPSEDLLKKYPLEPKKAWQIWAEVRKPKRWRAKEGGVFYRIEIDGEVFPRTESFTFGDNKLFEQFNYFRTEEEAQQAAEAVRKCLRKFHEKNCKQ